MNLRPSVLETDALPTELLPYALLSQQVYPRFCSALMRGPPSVSHGPGVAACRAVRITLRGVTALGTPTATGPNPCPRRSAEHSPTGPAHPPCSRLDIRLAAAVAGSAGGLLHHLFHPSPSRAGSVCCCSCRHRARAGPARMPVLAVSHGNHVCGSREVPLVKRVHERRNPDCFSELILTGSPAFGKFRGFLSLARTPAAPAAARCVPGRDSAPRPAARAASRAPTWSRRGCARRCRPARPPG